MKPDTLSILNDPALLKARDSHFGRMEALFGGEALDTVFALQGIAGQSEADAYREPERWVNEALDDLAEKANQLLAPAVFRPLLVELWPYGVHFIDRMFGAEVFELEPGNWQARYLDTPIGQLRPPELEKDETWRLAKEVARAFLAAEVAVPLFVLPVIASPLNIAVNLYGQEILVAMYTDPGAVRHDLRVINDVLCELHRWHLAHIPLEQLQPVAAVGRTQPPGFGQLCGCTTQLVSPGLYRDFIAALDDELLSVYPHGGMIHLCGCHTHDIPAWREMASLRSVQMNDRAAEDLEIYFHELRDDQVLYVNPCTGMPVERIVDITAGRRVVIVDDMDDTKDE